MHCLSGFERFVSIPSFVQCTCSLYSRYFRHVLFLDLSCEREWDRQKPTRYTEIFPAVVYSIYLVTTITSEMGYTICRYIHIFPDIIVVLFLFDVRAGSAKPKECHVCSFARYIMPTASGNQQTLSTDISFSFFSFFSSDHEWGGGGVLTTSGIGKKPIYKCRYFFSFSRFDHVTEIQRERQALAGRGWSRAAPGRAWPVGWSVVQCDEPTRSLDEKQINKSLPRPSPRSNSNLPAPPPSTRFARPIDGWIACALRLHMYLKYIYSPFYIW